MSGNINEEHFNFRFQNEHSIVNALSDGIFL